MDITEKEYKTALARSSNPETSEHDSNAYWQLSRQYRGLVFDREQAEFALQLLRQGHTF